MSEKTLPIGKLVPIIAITWALSLVTTLVVVYYSPNIFPPLNTDNINDDTITTDKICDGAIITTKLADGTVTSAKILDGTITATDLADGAIITVKITDGAITAAKIANGAISKEKIADGAVSSEKIVNGAIVTLKLADDSVTAAKVADNAIVTIKLADGAVTSAKILDGTIIAADLAADSVTAIKIADGAVTTTKIANYAVTSLKLAPSAIPFASTYSVTSTTTTETVSFTDMAGMSVTLNLDRTSHLIIMFSTEAGEPGPGENTLIRATVDGAAALPGAIYLTPIIYDYAATYDDIGIMAYSFNFYRPSVSSGTHTIKIQWVVTGGTGYVYYRALTVIALPA